MKHPLLIATLLVSTSILMVKVVLSDDDIREYRQHSVGVAAVKLPLYQEECGSCHMAYPPGLLPERSWKKIMAGLETHFGDNAELDADTVQKITDFLNKNSADKSSFRRSRKIMRSLDQNESPLRISKTPYIKHKHDEIPTRLIQRNNKVNSLANCNACHSTANKGIFDEHNVKIPGYGRWDD